jgi:hypothetical protein
MSRTKRKPPKSPEQIAAEKAAIRRRDFEAAELPGSAANLETSEPIEVRREGQKNVLTARRADVFDVLKPNMAPGAYDAARRLELDYRIRAGEAEGGSGGERVDCTMGRTTDLMLAAGERIDEVNGRLPIRDQLLLRCLIEPAQDATWRLAVQRLTGETHPHAQGAVVRGACFNLREAYASLERRRVA